MANKSLTDLVARTVTADSDLIHVNSGGTDYKETKQNFLRGDFFYSFANTSALTTQVDNLPTAATYFGSINSYGHQSETGMPENANYYVKVQRIGNSGYTNLEAWSVNDVENSHFMRTKAAGAWGEWKKVPSRSEITSLNNSLTNWVYLQIGSNTYGILNCRYNTSLKLCQMQWSGNGQTPGTTQYSFNLPSSPVLTPNFNSSTPLRNGDLMEVRTDGTVRVGLTGMVWSGGSIMYSIQ